MNIKEFRVLRYGPLTDSGKVELRSFNLFFGENEDGKTLTIDALVKLMFGGNIKDFASFEQINRVDESPEGYVILKDDKNKEIKIPEKGTFTKITGLTSSECRNIFIIRNSDLSVASENEFYISLADRLVGLRTRDLSKIKDTLRDIGRITPSYVFKNDKEEKLKTRIDKSGQLLKDIDELIQNMKTEDFDKLEIENVQLSEEADNVEQGMVLLEAARKRERFEKGKAALVKLEMDLQKLGDIDVFNQDDERIWRDAQRDIETFSNQKSDLVNELQSSKNTLTQKSEDLEAEKRIFGNLQSIKQKLSDEIKPELKDYETKRNDLIQQKNKSRFFTALSALSAILLAIALFGAILTSSMLFYVFAVVSGLLTAASWMTKFRYIASNARIAAIFDGVRLKTSQYNLSGESVEEILLKIQKFDEDYVVKSSELQELIRANENLKGKISELQDKKIPELDRRIESLDARIGELRKKSGENSLEAYSTQLKRKLDLQKSITEQQKVLESLFESKGKKMEENVVFWENEIGELAEFENEAKGTKFTEKQATTLKERQTQIKTRQKEIEEKLSSVQEKMKTIEREANEISRSDECLSCMTSTDLIAAKKAVEGFVGRNENNRSNVLDALGLFEDIENEEKNKVTDLFGDKSSVSRYFAEITGGIYKGVHLNADARQIQVERNNGERMDAEKLSAGAYDQLYLSIRLALGEKLLKGNKAFFIMDDPFVKADGKRLQNQMNILRRISQSGWQVIYFTAKDEVRDALKEDITSNQVNFIETHGIIT
jgi:DNA repair exonuclease SbcCD ATPase subunit